MKKEESSLTKEFPDMCEGIQGMKGTDDHFSSLSDRYVELQHVIHLLESGAKTFTNEHLEDLKKKRLDLKDELFSLLEKHPGHVTW